MLQLNNATGRFSVFCSTSLCRYLHVCVQMPYCILHCIPINMMCFTAVSHHYMQICCVRVCYSSKIHPICYMVFAPHRVVIPKHHITRAPILCILFMDTTCMHFCMRCTTKSKHMDFVSIQQIPQNAYVAFCCISCCGHKIIQNTLQHTMHIRKTAKITTCYGW